MTAFQLPERRPCAKLTETLRRGQRNHEGRPRRDVPRDRNSDQNVYDDKRLRAAIGRAAALVRLDDRARAVRCTAALVVASGRSLLPGAASTVREDVLER